ncbi:MAG: FliH/SctL family protein [Rhodocyclaceae bacterium]
MMPSSASKQVLRQAALQSQVRVLVRPVVQKTALQQAPRQDLNDTSTRARPSEQETERQRQLEAIAEETRVRAFETGRREGVAQGIDEGRAETKRLAEEQASQFDAILTAIETARLALAQAVESDMVELALACVGQLLAQNLIHPDVVRAQIRQQIERYAGEGGVCVRLAPRDYALLNGDEVFTNLLTKHVRAGGVRCVPDDGINAGGCIIETGAGATDARIETQLEQLKSRLVALYRERGERT